MNETIKIGLAVVFALFSMLLIGCEKENGLPFDGDGNEYDTVVIGTQVWLAENLKTTKYNNGVSIPLVTDNSQWASTKSAAFCWYDNNIDNKENYGALYNWFAVDAKLLCPVGWHVPSKDEWDTLINHLGVLAGAKLKDREIRFWINYDDCETKEFGFKARPGGGRNHIDGHFGGLGEAGAWWSSTESVYDSWIIGVDIRDDFCEINNSILIRVTGAVSIRCIKN